MQILIQSFLGIAERLSSSIHIRYSAMRTNSMVDSRNPLRGKEVEAMVQNRENRKRKSSQVIIRQPHTYLEPYIRSMYEGVEDIRIIVDRRFHERRQVVAPVVTDRRESTTDRRLSSPMLDILIHMEA
jgi:hypothetical protein